MHAESTAVDAPVDLGSMWRDLIRDPQSPERFELTERGEVVVSPLPANRHQRIVSRVAAQLREQLGDEVLYEIAVLTPSVGVRRPDLAWLPAIDIGDGPIAEPMESSPPLLVEVLSPGNRTAAMSSKIRAYLEGGAHEVLVVDLDGSVAFHRADGVHRESALGVKLSLPASMFR